MEIPIMLGGGYSWHGRMAVAETIFHYAAEHVASTELTAILASHLTQESFRHMDASYCWYLDNMTKADYLELDRLMDRLAADLPGAVAHWNIDRRDMLCGQFQEFRVVLKQRISQM